VLINSVDIIESGISAKLSLSTEFFFNHYLLIVFKYIFSPRYDLELKQLKL